LFNTLPNLPKDNSGGKSTPRVKFREKVCPNFRGIIFSKTKNGTRVDFNTFPNPYSHS
jgi:hypothetical protein